MRFEQLRLILGLAALIIILGSGALMTIFVLKQDSAQIERDEWLKLKATVAALAKIEPSPSYVNDVDPAFINPNQSVIDNPPLSHRVPINQADQAQLESLTGIGPSRAKAILAARATGPFRDLDDLHARVPKIPSSVLEDISLEITFD